MHTILEPLLALLVIVVPIGMAYFILKRQARQPRSGDGCNRSRCDKD